MDFNSEKLSFDRTEKRNYTLNVSAKELIDDCAKLLTVNAFACCNRCEMLNNEVLIEGIINFCAIIRNDQGIKKIERSERFSINETCQGATPKSYMLATADCEKVRGYIEAGNLMLNSAVNISAILITPVEVDCYQDIDGDEFRKKEQEICLNKIGYTKNIRFSVTEEKELSPRVPEVDQILSVTSSVCVKEAHISTGQLIIGGEVSLQTVYNSVDEYEPIVQVTDNFDFSHIIELKDIDMGNPIVNLSVEEISTSVLPNEQGEMRRITYSVGLCGYVYTTENNVCKVITDMYSISQKINCTMKNIDITELSESISVSTSKNIPVKVPENKTPIARINSVSFMPSVISCEMDMLKAIVKCNGEVSVVYTASGTGETDGFNTSVNFDIGVDSVQFNDIKDILATISLKDMQAVLLAGNEVEIRAGFFADFVPQKTEKSSVISDISIDEECDFPEFGIIIYNVQKGENLWDICKKYGVDIDEIKKLNNDLSDNPEANRKIYIFRKLAV